MAKTSVYLPDELAEQAKAYGIPVSEVVQAAVRQAVRAAQIEENVMTDISAVAERRGSPAPWPKARAHGAEWARRHATATELEYMAEYGGRAERFLVPTSLIFYESEERNRDGASVPCRPADPFWSEFRAGAREVWDTAQPLLAETGGHGTPYVPASDREAARDR
jgi:post-segregation antitoxin (ccd killing protein)